MRMLFIGFNHSIDGPRLVHREMKHILEEIPDIELYWIGVKNVDRDYWGFNPDESYVSLNNHGFQQIQVKHPLSVRNNSLGHIFHNLLNYMIRLYKLLAVVDRYNIDVVQASDVGELLPGVLCKYLKNCSLVYDSHEDYVSLFLDYFERSIPAYIHAFKVWFSEFLLIRFCDHVFCTDSYLYEKYGRWIYSVDNISLLRNFPLGMEASEEDRDFRDKKTLSLVYIGGVNKYKGVRECCRYIERFNQENPGRWVSLDIYSDMNPLVGELMEKDFLTHHSRVKYQGLMSVLPGYDVGVCLWLPIQKYRRNIPLKNFDYMAAGLPVLTSDFGNLAGYIQESGAGVCIDPGSYRMFKEGLDYFFDGGNRRECFLNGLKYVGGECDFRVEGQGYIGFLKKVC